MAGQEQNAGSIFAINLGRRAIALAVTIMFAATILAVPAAHAETFRVLHTFTGYGDGGEPIAGLTLDRAGNLYGTTSGGGAGGTVFKLSHVGSTAQHFMP